MTDLQKVASGQLFRHYKGGLYKIITSAIDETAGHVVVIYQSNADGRVWSRPHSEFFGDVVVDEKQISRFSIVPAEPVLLQDLPFGARFKYKEDSQTIWVLLQRHDCGVIAKWDGNILGYMGQSICSAEETEVAMKELRVYPVD